MEPELDLQALKREIEKEAARLKTLTQASGDSAVNAPESHAAGKTPAQAPLRDLRLPELRFVPEYEPDSGKTVSYRELARHEDREFVQNAFYAILRRAPDPRGEEVYVQRLRRAQSKIEILLRLRLSKEGMAQRTIPCGFILPLFLDALYRIPLLGYAFRVIREIVLLPVTNRRLRENQERMREHVNASLGALKERANELSRRRKERG